MSFFTLEHTFAAWAEKELAKLFTVAPKIEQVVDTVLKYVGPALQIIVASAAGSAAGAEVAKVIAEIQSDLTAVSGLVYDFGANPTVASIVSSAQTNLSALLTAGHITGATSTAIVTKVASELGGLATALTTPTT